MTFPGQDPGGNAPDPDPGKYEIHEYPEYPADGYPPPPAGYYAPPPGNYPPPYPGPYPSPYGSPYPVQPTTNGTAVAALVTSLAGIPLMGLCCTGVIAAIAGIVLGVVALNQLKDTPQGGRGMAIAGIAIGAALLIVTVLALVFWAFSAHLMDGSWT